MSVQSKEVQVDVVYAKCSFDHYMLLHMEQENCILLRKAAAISYCQSRLHTKKIWRWLTQSDQHDEEKDHWDVYRTIFYDLRKTSDKQWGEIMNTHNPATLLLLFDRIERWADLFWWSEPNWQAFRNSDHEDESRWTHREGLHGDDRYMARGSAASSWRVGNDPGVNQNSIMRAR